MAIWIAPDSAEGVERAKWERPKNQMADGVHGMNRVGYEEFPKCLYKAGRPKMGGVEVTESTTVRSEQEERLALGQGWARTQEDAIQLVHDQHTELATLAANRAYHEQRMSEPAQREAADREAAMDTVQHVPELPAVPVKRKH